jgi:hypothetical protein
MTLNPAYSLQIQRFQQFNCRKEAHGFGFRLASVNPFHFAAHKGLVHLDAPAQPIPTDASSPFQHDLSSHPGFFPDRLPFLLHGIPFASDKQVSP